MKNLKYFVISLIIFMITQGCSTTRLIKPLDKGETRIGVDIGGPMVGFPLPLSSISVAHGVHEKVSVFGGLHTTSLAYNTLQLDLGANIGLLEPNKLVPGLSTNIILNPITEFREGTFSLFPETSLNTYWKISEQHFPYLSLTGWYDFSYKNAALDKGGFLHPTLAIGYNYEGSKWNFGLEGKWLNFDKEILVPELTPLSVGGNGGVGIYFKVSYKIFKK